MSNQAEGPGGRWWGGSHNRLIYKPLFHSLAGGWGVIFCSKKVFKYVVLKEALNKIKSVLHRFYNSFKLKLPLIVYYP